MFDHHQRGVGHIHADFDHGGGHQHIQTACGKFGHHGGFFGGFHAAVYEADVEFGQGRLKLLQGFGGGLQLEGFALFDQRADPICLLPFAADVQQIAFDFGTAQAVDEAGLDGRAAGREFVDDGYVEVGEKAHGEGARDRSGGHHELVHVAAFVFQGETLRHAEAVLFVHNHEAEVLKGHVVLKQGVRADGDFGEAV